MRPLWRWYVGGAAAVLVTNWMAVRVPVQMAGGLDALRAGRPGVMDAALVIAALGVGIVVTRTLSRVWFFTPGRLAEFSLREDLFAHCLRLQPDFYARFPTGDLLARVTSDVTYARAFAGFALLQGVNVVGALGMGVWQMLRISPLLTAACAVPVLVAAVGLQLGTGRLFRLQRQAQAQLAALSDELLGTLQGVATVQAFCAEGVFADRLDGRAADLRRTNLSLAWLRALVFPLLTVAGGVCVWLLLALGGPMALEGRISAGQLAAFVALVVYVVVPMRILGWLVPVFQRSEVSLERIHAVLDAVPDRPDLPAGRPFPASGRGPSITVRGLTFAWPDAPDRPVLRDVDLEIPAGATVGIYGATGAGKTTLLRVLARLATPPPGTVLVDGVDVRGIDLDDYRRHLALVPQAPFLFSETVRENVGLGAGDAAVRAAVRAAALEPDLAAFPEGLDTVVGERGIALSGGQRQRVAIARGLLRDAELVLLDDVLSAVDHHTEQELLAMLRARTSATRILVSHRLSALERADFVLVMASGRVVDRGTHAELIARPGPYRDAWDVQRGEGT